MSNDTRWVVGTGVAIVTAIFGTGGVLAGLLVTQMGAMHARLDGLDDRLRAVEIGFGQVQQRLRTVELGLRTVEQRLSNVEQGLQTVEQRLSNVEQRLSNVEQHLSNVEQRLQTIERIVLPPPTAPGE